jgi:hypothetical protein
MDNANKPQRRPNNPATSGKRERKTGPRPRSTVSWSEVDNQLLRDAIVSICDNGAAVIFGKTTDGGALSITVLDGNDKIREWPHSIEDVENTLRWLVDMFSTD